ncbi:hypothetical protein WI80_33385 [Burkholderia ubonensis]|nr:hypothetical protein WI80_33385 [Burkholderia ubonensis]KVU12669.1 hypothetical protein WK63_19415 [Burkholderia ubonensis]
MTVRPAHADEARAHCARAVRFDTTNGGESLDHLLTVGRCYVVEEDGRPVAAWSQQIDAAGVLRVLVYGGRGATDLTVLLARCLESQGAPAAQFQTRRPGLIKKAEALGYRVVGRAPCGVIMRKDFQ